MSEQTHSRVEAIYGLEIAPGYVDRYLAKFVNSGQETEEPVSPGGPDNLFEPAAESYGAHGIFHGSAGRCSHLTCLDLHRGAVAMGVTAVAFGWMRGRDR